MLAPELQGGSSVVVEVDQRRVREYVLDDLLHEARSVLRNARIGLATPLAIQNDSVELKPIGGDYQAALAKLEELSRAFNGVRAAEIAEAGNGVIRVIPTEAHVQEYERPTGRSTTSAHDYLASLQAWSAKVLGASGYRCWGCLQWR